MEHDYLAALYKIEKRADLYPSVSIEKLTQIGVFIAISLRLLPGLMFTCRNKREIRIERDVNEKLIAIIAKPTFVRCGDKPYLKVDEAEAERIVDAFGHGAIVSVTSQWESVEMHDWRADNDIKLIFATGRRFWFEDDISATLFVMRFGGHLASENPK